MCIFLFTSTLLFDTQIFPDSDMHVRLLFYVFIYLSIDDLFSCCRVSAVGGRKIEQKASRREEVLFALAD